jgi:hypothetical protein
MAKKFKAKKYAGIIGMIIGLIAIIGVGGLFINGTFLNVVLLKYLPLLVHQIVGWILVGGSILSGVLSLVK